MHSDPADVVVAFLNTLDVEEQTDILDNQHRWRDWIGTTLPRTPISESGGERDSARSLRTHLRALAAGERPTHPQHVTASVILDHRGVRLESDTIVGSIAAAVAQLEIEGRWDRVKICPADDCRWAFYDASRNHSRQWCSMRVCGNRAKVRKHRERDA